MSLGISATRLRFLCAEYTVRTRRICQLISFLDVVTLVILVINFLHLLNGGRTDEIVFGFATLAAGVIQFITATLSFFFITIWGNLKFVPYHQSSKITFVVCFVLERIVKDLVECYALKIEYSKCNSMVAITIGNLLFTLLHLYCIYILRVIRRNWQEAVAQAFRMWMQPDQEEQVMDGIAVEVCGHKFEEEFEADKNEEIAQSYKFTINESANPYKIKLKEEDVTPRIIVFDEVNLIPELERTQSSQGKKTAKSILSLTVISISSKEKHSKSIEDEEINETSLNTI